jgi:hypothetical protein
MGDSLSFDYVKLQITVQIPTSNFKRIVSLFPESQNTKFRNFFLY